MPKCGTTRLPNEPSLPPSSWSEWSMTQVDIDKDWSCSVASLVIDALVTAKIVAKTDFDRAVEIAAEEIVVRLSVGDRPSLDNVRHESRWPVKCQDRDHRPKRDELDAQWMTVTRVCPPPGDTDEQRGHIA